MAETNITGLDELYKQLQNLPTSIEVNVMRGALRAGLNQIKRVAEARVPQDSGALRKSIRIRADRKALKRGVVRLNLVAGNKEAFYAHLVEYGTASFYTGTGKTVGGAYKITPKGEGKGLAFGGGVVSSVTHPGIKPQPFMRPAVDEAGQSAFEAARAYIAKRLPKEIEKAKK